MKYIIYTSGNFPYGDAASNFVRLMSVGLLRNQKKVHVKLLRGFWFKNNNKKDHNGITFSTVFLKNKPNNWILKIIELIGNFLFLPFHLMYDIYFKKTNNILVYGIDYPYYLLWFLIAKKIFNVKVIRIIADSYSKENISINKLLILKWKLYNFQKKVLDKHFSGIICLSNYLKKEQIANGILPLKIIVIPHFINTEVNEIKADKKLLNNKKIKICFSGSFNSRNGFFYLLDVFEFVFKKDKEFQLVLIGSEDSLNKNESEKFNRCKSIFGENLIITGRVSYNQVISTLKSCDILLNPRQKSIESEAGFPTKLGEYFSVNKPVISTNIGDIGVYFKNGKCLLLAEHNNAINFAKKILLLSNDKNKQLYLARNGLIWAKKNINYINNAKKTIEFVNHL